MLSLLELSCRSELYTSSLCFHIRSGWYLFYCFNFRTKKHLESAYEMQGSMEGCAVDQAQGALGRGWWPGLFP